MAGFIGLATGLGRIGAGLGRARREAADANQRDAERAAAVEREVQQQAFANWLQRSQLENAAKDREAARQWQEKAFSAGQEERAAARADQAAYREAQMQEAARMQRERLDQQKELAGQQLETRRMLAAMAQSGQGQQRRNETRDDRNVNQLAQRFQANPVVKDAYGVANALGTIKAGLSNESPMADLQTMYAVVKLFDPGSVVREGEIKLSRSANSLPGRAQLLWNNWTKGRILTPEMRAQIAGLVDEQMGQYETRLSPIQGAYGQQARSRGVEADSAFIAPSPFEGVRAIKGPAPKGRPGIADLLRKP